MRRFPLVVRLHFDALVGTQTILRLVCSVQQFDLRVVGEHIKTEVIIRPADVELVVVKFEGVVESCVTARMRTRTGLVSCEVSHYRTVRKGQEVRTMVGVTHLKDLRIAHHAKSRHAECVSFRQTEVQARASEESAAAMGLSTFLRQMALNERRVQHLATCTREVITVCHASSVTDVIAVADVEITVHRPCVEVDIKAHVTSRRGCPGFGESIVDSRLHGTVVARCAVFLHDEVDDTGCAFGREFRRRVGNDLYLLDGAGRHLLQYLTAVLGVEARRLAVDPDLYIFAVSQTDGSFLINIDGRDVLQDVRDRRTSRSDVLIDGEDLLVEFKAHGAALSYDLDILQNLAVFLERYTSHVQRLAGYRNLLAALLIAHERNNQHVFAVLDFDGEVSLLVGHGSRDEF